jgi:hypothetical protein
MQLYFNYPHLVKSRISPSIYIYIYIHNTYTYTSVNDIFY